MTNKFKMPDGWKFVAILPLLAGVITACILYSKYDTSSTALSHLNIHTWAIMRYSPVGGYALLHMMLISNVVMVFIGTILYLIDIIRAVWISSSKQGNGLLAIALLLGGAALFVCFTWIYTYGAANVLSNAGFDAENFLDTLVDQNDLFVIGVFVLFLIGDICLSFGYDLCGAVCERKSEERGTFERRQRFARNSILLIDVPVLLASILLWFMSHYALIDLRFDTLGPKAYVYFSHSASGGSMKELENILPKIFANGFILGAIISQLAYSQIVFAILNWREEKKEEEAGEATKTVEPVAGNTPVLSQPVPGPVMQKTGTAPMFGPNGEMSTS